MERRELIKAVLMAFVIGLIVSFIFALDGVGSDNKTPKCNCSCNCHNCEAIR